MTKVSVGSTARRVEHGRLVYYRPRPPDEAFWSGHWQGVDVKTMLRIAADGDLGEYGPCLLRSLGSKDVILEAGCGYGRFVVGLAAVGYTVTGIEFSAETVALARKSVPQCDIIEGDVLNLPFDSESYEGYVSLGVVEHFKDGPESALAEAYRVLRPGGIIVCSVPFFSPLRFRKARKGAYDDDPRGFEFYQYAFSESQIVTIFRDLGFRVIDVDYHGATKGLKDEIRTIGWLRQKSRIARRLITMAAGMGPIRKRVAHMVTVAAERPKLCPAQQ